MKVGSKVHKMMSFIYAIQIFATLMDEVLTVSFAAEE